MGVGEGEWENGQETPQDLGYGDCSGRSGAHMHLVVVVLRGGYLRR